MARRTRAIAWTLLWTLAGAGLGLAHGGLIQPAAAFTQRSPATPVGHEHLTVAPTLNPDTCVSTNFPELVPDEDEVWDNACALCDHYSTNSWKVWSTVIGQRWADIMGTLPAIESDCFDAVAQNNEDVQYDHFLRTENANGDEGAIATIAGSVLRFKQRFVDAAIAADSTIKVLDGGGSRRRFPVVKAYFLFGRALHVMQDSFSAEHAARSADGRTLVDVNSYFCTGGSLYHTHATPWVSGSYASHGDIIWESHLGSQLKKTAGNAWWATGDLWLAFMKAHAQRTRAAAEKQADAFISNWMRFDPKAVRARKSRVSGDSTPRTACGAGNGPTQARNPAHAANIASLRMQCLAKMSGVPFSMTPAPVIPRDTTPNAPRNLAAWPPPWPTSSNSWVRAPFDFAPDDLSEVHVFNTFQGSGRSVKMGFAPFVQMAPGLTLAPLSPVSSADASTHLPVHVASARLAILGIVDREVDQVASPQMFSHAHQDGVTSKACAQTHSPEFARTLAARVTPSAAALVDRFIGMIANSTTGVPPPDRRALVEGSYEQLKTTLFNPKDGLLRVNLAGKDFVVAWFVRGKHQENADTASDKFDAAWEVEMKKLAASLDRKFDSAFRSGPTSKLKSFRLLSVSAAKPLQVTAGESVPLALNRPGTFAPLLPNDGSITGDGTTFTYHAPQVINQKSNVHLLVSPADDAAPLFMEVSLLPSITLATACPAKLALGEKVVLSIKEKVRVLWHTTAIGDEVSIAPDGQVLTLAAKQADSVALSACPKEDVPRSVEIHAMTRDGRGATCKIEVPGKLHRLCGKALDLTLRAGDPVEIRTEVDSAKHRVNPVVGWSGVTHGSMGMSPRPRTDEVIEPLTNLVELFPVGSNERRTAQYEIAQIHTGVPTWRREVHVHILSALVQDALSGAEEVKGMLQIGTIRRRLGAISAANADDLRRNNTYVAPSLGSKMDHINLVGTTTHGEPARLKVRFAPLR